MHFLSGATNNQSGWDGWVECLTQKGQLHRSVWELTTREDTEVKFDEDYKASLQRELPAEWLASEVIYVAATLREKFTEQRKKRIQNNLVKKYRKRWGWIVVLDANDFVKWIEQLPWVESWASQEIGLGNGRFGKTLTQAWRVWAQESKPAVTTELVSAGRDLAPLRTALSDGRTMLATQGDSPHEAMALVFCAVQSLPANEAKALLASSLVVYDEASAGELADQLVLPHSRPFTVLMPPAVSKSELLIAAGHRVVHAFGRSSSRPSVLTVSRAGVGDFKGALNTTMGLEDRNAEIQARACGCSVSVWKIRNLHERGISQSALPVWAQSGHEDIVVPAVFLGGWNVESNRDKKLLKSLSTFDAIDFFSRIQKFGICDDPLFEVIGTHRALIAPTAAFAFVAPHITTAHLDRLRLVCKEVFAVITPEVSARWEGQPSEPRIRNPREEYSDWVLDGLAETLLRIAVLDDDLNRSGALSTYGSGQAFVNQLVRDLPGLSADPRLMASLNQRLPIFAEAAIDPFVDALETLLQGDAMHLRLWLGDESGIFGMSFHTGLLWALEMMAWSSDYLPKAASLLARFAAVDPGGQLSNRPLNSLREIFLAWHPQTSASLETRVTVLRIVCHEIPAVGWQLLLKLLPGPHQIAHQTNKPVWRDFGQTNQKPLTRGELQEAYRRYIDLALEVAGVELSKLANLVRDYGNLSSSHQQRLEDALKRAATEDNSESDKLTTWRALHDVVVRHRGFADAEWAMSDEKLTSLEGIASQFIVKDVVERHRWLFDSQMPETGHAEVDHVGWQAQVDGKRDDAIKEIMREEGWDGIHRLVQDVKYPHIVGGQLATQVADEKVLLEALDVWRKSATRAGSLAIQSASGSRFYKSGDAWTESLVAFARLRSWEYADIANALLNYPDSKATFDLVLSLGRDVNAKYWKERYGYVRLGEDDVDAMRHVVLQFIENDRAVELIDMNRQWLKKLGYTVTIQVLDAMLEQMARGIKLKNAGTISYDVEELFKWRRAQPEASIPDLARREYSLLPLFSDIGQEGSQLSLHFLMATDASFYIDVLCDLYKPDDGERETAGRSEEEIANRAHAAFELLQSWRTPPGVSEGQIVDAKELEAWIDTVRSTAESRKRGKIADQQIGKILYYVPKATDEIALPPLVVRELIERLRSKEIETGFKIEEFNSRGVTSRGMYDGGTQEKVIEARWRESARIIDKKWPRSHALCVAIAESWRHQAEMEDNEVKKRRTQESR